jgi:hypothetical protein
MNIYEDETPEQKLEECADLLGHLLLDFLLASPEKNEKGQSDIF